MWIKNILKRVTTPEQRVVLRRIASYAKQMISMRNICNIIVPRAKKMLNVCYITANMRVLPDFLILGTQKGGTTALFFHLIQHPDIIPPCTKEPNYFNIPKKELNYFNVHHHYKEGEKSYRACFPSIFQKYFHKYFSKGKMFLTGEATPNYLFFPYIPSRVVALLPRVKNIILLRNPVDRAYSQYLMNMKFNWESRTFDEAIAEERQQFAECPDFHWEETQGKDPHFYLARGIYQQQLERWFKLYPRENFLIIQSENYFAEPETVLTQIVQFLGLRSYVFTALGHIKKYNKNVYTEAMSPETKDFLQNFFKPHNQKLYEYLGVDYGW